MNIVGLSAFYHESACCLLCDGELLAAVSEERFTRRKYDPRLPVEAFRFCLEAGGLTITDVDALAYYELPRRKLARQLWAGTPAGGGDLPWLDAGRVERALREGLGFEGRIFTFPHHLSHAASAFSFSPFEDAAILTVDGVGEWATTAYGRGHGSDVELFEEVVFPHSLGLLYSTVTSYLGFRVNDGEAKVMGLAAYGEPRYVDEICQLVGMGSDGQYLLNMRYFDFLRGEQMYTPAFPELFGQPPRPPSAEITAFHHDVARSLQLVLEEILLEKLAYLKRRVDSPNLWAGHFGMSARTLQRHLSGRGYSFQALVDDSRRELAERLLKDTQYPLAEVAFLTGFSEQSAFNRAFKRWAGQTPRSFRIQS